MARVTIEDSVTAIANRFRVVMCCAQRGRELASGVEPTVERDRLIKHEKNAVIALREITQGNLDLEALEDSIVRNHRRFSPIEAAAEEDGEEGASGLSADGVISVSGGDVLPEIHAEAIFGRETEAEVETEAEAEVETETETEAGVEVETEAEAGVEVETEAEAGASDELVSDVEAAAEVEVEAEAEADAEVEAEADAEVSSDGAAEVADEKGS